MAKLFDTHAHYFDEKFSALEGGAPALLEQLFSSNIGYILNAATTTRDSAQVLALADRFDGCFAAVGVHPENCAEEADLRQTLDKLRTLLKHPKVVAIGEIGLDYHWEENPPKELQREFFTAQLRLAEELHLPVIIHDRDAHGDTFDLLSAFPGVTAILHSYSGSPEMARQYLRCPNRFISFSGVLTYKNAVQTVETAKLIPINRMLLETDCPYLPPVPHRGKLNHSGLMIHTAERLAQIRGMTLEGVIEKTTQNAFEAFNIKI